MSSDDERSEENRQRETPKLPKKLEERLDEVGTNIKQPLDPLHSDHDLKSKQPVQVVECFLALKQSEYSDWTLRDYSYDLTRLLEYFEYSGIDDFSELSSSDLSGFKTWRKRDENVNLTTLHGQLANLRVFLRWCEKKDLVADGLADDIDMPDVDDEDMVSYVRLDEEEAQQIIEHNQQFPYVTREFAEFVVMWEGLCRLGGVRSLDLKDYDRQGRYIDLTHNPQKGTPLKNGESNEDTEKGGGERQINLPEWVCDVLNRYIDGTSDPEQPQRIDVTDDDDDRQPLFTTSNGRVSEATVRRDLYRITQPCRHGRACPYGREPDECEAYSDNNRLSRCPSSVSPHPVRRGGICNQIKQGVDKDEICQRANVSRGILDKHYDLRSREEARKQRRKELAKNLDGYADPARLQPSSVESRIPLWQDAVQLKRRAQNQWDDSETRQRAVHTLAGVVVFIALVAINFAFLGIGIDPVNHRLFFELW